MTSICVKYDRLAKCKKTWNLNLGNSSSNQITFLNVTRLGIEPRTFRIFVFFSHNSSSEPKQIPTKPDHALFTFKLIWLIVLVWWIFKLYTEEFEFEIVQKSLETFILLCMHVWWALKNNNQKYVRTLSYIFA
jgi:hypothetical protein